LDLDADMAEAHVNLGRQLHLLGERGRAEPHYREAVRLDPDDPRLTSTSACCWKSRGGATKPCAYRQAVLREPRLRRRPLQSGIAAGVDRPPAGSRRHLMAARQLSGEAE
jgi:hypothetical protein